MPHHDAWTVERWDAALHVLDRRIASALSVFRRTQRLSADDVARGFSELGKLRDGRDPDYELAGTASAYAWRYLARRVSCIAAALNYDGPERPKRVLDIGSGADATTLAIEVLYPNAPGHIITVEPSRTMTRLALCLHGTGSQVVRLTRFQNSLEDIATRQLHLPKEWFDLVVLSACLPYEARGWTRFKWMSIAESIAKLTRPPSRVIVVEPEAKQPELDALLRSLLQTGYYRTRTICCHELPRQFCRGTTLRATSRQLDAIQAGVLASSELTQRGRILLGDPPFPTTSWHWRRKDIIGFAIER